MRSKSDELVIENLDFLDSNQNYNNENNIPKSEDIEEVVLKHSFKKTTFSDIMTVQCILCIILAIIAVSANILIPEITNGIINEYKAVNDSDNKVNSEIIKFVSKISSTISKNAEV